MQTGPDQFSSQLKIDCQKTVLTAVGGLPGYTPLSEMCRDTVGNDRNVGTAWREWGTLGMGLLKFIAWILPSCLFLPTSTHVSLSVIIKPGTLAIKSKTIQFTTYLGLSWNKVASNMPDATKEQQISPTLGRCWIPWEKPNTEVLVWSQTTDWNKTAGTTYRQNWQQIHFFCELLLKWTPRRRVYKT